jgi:dihydrofolate reductase
LAITLVAALSRNRVIGREGGLPWKLPEDLRRFKALTLGKPIVMGRKTLLSMGRPLPGRDNIVLTRDAAFDALGCEITHTLDEALAAARAHGPEVMVIGGAEVFAAALPLADAMVLTEVDAEVEGDVYFPAFDTTNWESELVERVPVSAINPIAFSVFRLRRVRSR